MTNRPVVYACKVFFCDKEKCYGGTISCYSSRRNLCGGGPPLTVLYRTSGDTARFVHDDLLDNCKRMGIKFYSGPIISGHIGHG